MSLFRTPKHLFPGSHRLRDRFGSFLSSACPNGKRRRCRTVAVPAEVLEDRTLLAANVFDIDFDGQSDALSDGIGMVRFLAGFSDEALVDNVLNLNGQRLNPDEVEQAIDNLLKSDRLDIDDDGATTALGDGLTIVRWLAGFNGESLIRGTVNPAGARNTAQLVEAYLNQIQSEGILQNLTTSLDQVVVGIPEQILFQAFVGSAAQDARMMLHNATAVGAEADFLLELFDDGQAIHGDTEAGDGIFANRLAVSIENPGSRYFSARLESTGERAITALRGIERPTDQVVMRRLQVAADAKTLLRTEIDGGATPRDAIESVRQSLVAKTEDVDRDSIAVTEDSIFWKSAEGITNVLFTNEANADIKGGFQATAPSSTTDLHELELSTQANAAALNRANVSRSTARAQGDPCGKAIILAPYFWQFSTFDESDDIEQSLRNANFDVTAKYNNNQNDQNITIDDFKNLGEYDAIVVSSHGDSHSRYGEIILTGEVADDVSIFLNIVDLLTGRLALSGDSYAVTPKFIRHYSGSMDGAIVYISACRSSHNGRMALAFLGQGAEAYIGYSDYVGSGFANVRGQRVFDHLLQDGNTVGTIPGINSDVETDSDPATFELIGRRDAELERDCRLVNDFDLFVEYKWPLIQKDLDTGTTFLSNTVGFSCGASGDYLSFSGDDTSGGGTETVIIDLNAAFDVAAVGEASSSSLAAGWYEPAEGSGPATLTVGLRNKDTGEIVDVVTRAISPGRQDNCAATGVGTINITINGEGDDAIVSFELV